MWQVRKVELALQGRLRLHGDQLVLSAMGKGGEAIVFPDQVNSAMTFQGLSVGAHFYREDGHIRYYFPEVGREERFSGR